MNVDNNMFNADLSALYEDNLSHLVYFFRLLNKLHISVGTHYTLKISTADLFIFLDHPRLTDPIYQYAIKYQKRCFLVVFENSYINEYNFDKNYHNLFEKIFTWDDQIIDEGKYIHLSYKFNINKKKIRYEFDNKKLIALIAANKSFNGPHELYSLRLSIIRWFAKNHSKDFKFYGRDWKYFRFAMNSKFRFLNRFNIPNLPLFSILKLYGGAPKDKGSILCTYKFSICFENSSNDYGYISEKIFDCFFNNCIPIYYGAPNIDEYIPDNCFVDYRKFKSIDDLYKYISSIDRDKFDQYIHNIQEFLNSRKGRDFCHKNFARTLIRSFYN
jgi:hypothetical protein